MIIYILLFIGVTLCRPCYSMEGMLDQKMVQARQKHQKNALPIIVISETCASFVSQSSDIAKSSKFFDSGNMIAWEQPRNSRVDFSLIPVLLKVEEEKEIFLDEVTQENVNNIVHTADYTGMNPHHLSSLCYHIKEHYFSDCDADTKELIEFHIIRMRVTSSFHNKFSKIFCRNNFYGNFTVINGLLDASGQNIVTLAACGLKKIPRSYRNKIETLNFSCNKIEQVCEVDINELQKLFPHTTCLDLR